MTWPGWERFTPTALVSTTPKRAKYGAVRTTVDGIAFDSKREADRYQELKLEQTAGAITDLELQPQFPLHVTTPEGTMVVIGRYIADFRYRRWDPIHACRGPLIVEDAKGVRTEAYKLKKRHVETEYGVVIRET